MFSVGAKPYQHDLDVSMLWMSAPSGCQHPLDVSTLWISPSGAERQAHLAEAWHICVYITVFHVHLFDIYTFNYFA